MVSREELPDKLTVSETADMLGLSVATIKTLAHAGDLTYVGEMGYRDIDTDSLVEYVNRRYGRRTT
jgi:hypothetical protein